MQHRRSNMKFLISILVILSLSTVINAEVRFTQSGVTSIAQAQSFQYKLYQTLPLSTQFTIFILTNLSCTAGSAPQQFNCTATNPTNLNTDPLVKYELSAQDIQNAGVESGRSVPFFFQSQAAVPTNPSITR